MLNRLLVFVVVGSMIGLGAGNGRAEMVDQSGAQMVNQPAVQMPNQLGAQTLNQPGEQTVNQPDAQMVNQPAAQTTNQPTTQTTNQPCPQMVEQPCAKKGDKPATKKVGKPGTKKAVKSSAKKEDKPTTTTQTDKSNRTILVAAPWTVFTKVKRGMPVGVLAETTDIILKRMGFNPVFVGMSMGEIPKAMKENQVAASALMVKTPDNEKNILLTEPIVNEYTAVVVRRGESFPLERLSDLRGRKIGGRQGYRYPLLEEDGEIKIEGYRSDGEVMRSLLLHKVDIVLVSALSNVFSFRVEGVINKLEILPIAVGIVPLRVALSPKVFTPADQTRFNTLIVQVRGEPIWQDILAKNGFADLIRDFPLLKK